MCLITRYYSLNILSQQSVSLFMPVMIDGTKLTYVAQKMSYALFLTMAGAPLHMLKGQNH